jgi:hypothetical protein
MNTSPDMSHEVCGSRLRRLPTELQPPYNWQEFRRRAQMKSRIPSHRVQGWQVAAACALLVLVIGAAIWGWRATPTVPVADQTDVSRAIPRGGSDAVTSLTNALTSSEIESWLRSLPDEPAVVRVGTRAAVAGLEDRIAQVDDLLNSERLDGAESDRLAALQKERARLVGSLAQVRYAEVVASAAP